jgi:predicted RND superfamily exporter protein
VGTSSVDGETKWLLQIFPRQQVWDLEPLQAFIQDLRQVDPEVTGTPVQTFEATRDIVKSYQLIGLYSIVAVLLILLIDYRFFETPLTALWHSVLALLPPFLGAGVTFGILGVMNVDLNPANLIVLPLIVGIGVDGGVHVVHDYRRSHSGRYQTSSATFSAILLNGTTTIAGFGSMMIADHRGIKSLGFVLAVGVAACLFVAVVILPAILAWMTVSRPGREPTPSVETTLLESDGPTTLQFVATGGQVEPRESGRSPMPETGVLPLRRTPA